MTTTPQRPVIRRHRNGPRPVMARAAAVGCATLLASAALIGPAAATDTPSDSPVASPDGSASPAPSSAAANLPPSLDCSGTISQVGAIESIRVSVADPDGDPVTVHAGLSMLGIRSTVSGHVITYPAPTDATGQDWIPVTASDGRGGQAQCDIGVLVERASPSQTPEPTSPTTTPGPGAPTPTTAPGTPAPEPTAGGPAPTTAPQPSPSGPETGSVPAPTPTPSAPTPAPTTAPGAVETSPAPGGVTPRDTTPAAPGAGAAEHSRPAGTPAGPTGDAGGTGGDPGGPTGDAGDPGGTGGSDAGGPGSTGTADEVPGTGLPSHPALDAGTGTPWAGVIPAEIGARSLQTLQNAQEIVQGIDAGTAARGGGDRDTDATDGAADAGATGATGATGAAEPSDATRSTGGTQDAEASQASVTRPAATGASGWLFALVGALMTALVGLAITALPPRRRQH